MSHLAPCTSEAGDYLSFDFTEYAWYDIPSEFAGWLSDGWTGVTALGLAGSQSTGMGWITETMVEETGRSVSYTHLIRRPPAGRLSAALPAAGAATANPAEAVPAEAENSERSGYENNTQAHVRAIAGTGSIIVALRLYTCLLYTSRCV